MPKPYWVNNYEKLWLFNDMCHSQEKLKGGKTKVIVGQFYEELAAKMFKGEHAKNEERAAVYPDVICWNQNGGSDILIESKASYQGKHWIIDVQQIEEYNKLKENDFPFTKPDIYYVLFMHDVKDMAKRFGIVSELIKELCKNTIVAFKLSLEFVQEIAKNCQHYEYSVSWGRYEQGHTHYIRFRPTITNQLATKNFDKIMEIFGKFCLNFDKNWQISRKYCRNLEIIGNKINSFPLISVERV